MIRSIKPAILSVLLLGTLLTVGASTPQDSWQKGIVILKVTMDNYIDLRSVEGATELGNDMIDDYLKSIGASVITHRFPTAKPPKKAGDVDLRPVYEIHFSQDIEVPEVADRLMNLPGVVWACPAVIHQVFLDHDDPRRNEQYGLDRISANAAHDVTTGSTDVVVAITDTGILMAHEDLNANIWVNPGEDLNGNGTIEQNERNNQDDDNNGKIDDFYGWDLVANNNNPADSFGHGTHVAGIVSAVTNNETGISSIGYNIKLMNVRIGQGPGITQGYPGIVYSVDAGADVINCSWGGGQNSPEGQDALRYCVQNDVLLVAAAGNAGSTNPSYPAAYPGAFAVAATSQSDAKAGFSNYGNWVDISAPGVAILSTTRDGAYGTMDGTSMAAPYVAGAAGLLRSEFPDFDAPSIADLLYYSADDLHERNGQLADLMGGGRLNVDFALRIVNQPLLVYRGSRLASDQNRNGKLDPGERATITATMINRGHAPDSIIVRLSSNDPDVDILVGEVRFPNLDRGESYTNDDNPFTFDIADGIIPHTTRFTITVDAQPGDFHTEESFPMLIGHPNVLIVDDDEGLDYETYIQTSIEDMRQGYLSWDVSASVPPEPDTMLQYRMVVWVTGNSGTPLTEQERWAIGQVAERGGNLMLSGRYIGDDFNNTHFLRTAFGVANSRDSVNVTSVLAPSRAGRPLEPGVEMFIDGLGGSGDGLVSPSSMILYRTADTLAVYRYEGQTTGIAAAYREDEDTFAKMAYFGFTIEAISDSGTTRDQFMEQMLSWFAPDLAIPIEQDVTPLFLGLEPAFPNPFNASTRISFTIQKGFDGRLIVRDLLGREVTTLFEGRGSGVPVRTIWNANQAPSGTYYLELDSPGLGRLQQNLILVK